MSTAILRSPARSTFVQPEPVTELECEACGSSMEARPNRYFGTGLAIHRYVALCKRCNHVAFVPEPEEEIAPAGRFVTALRVLFSRAA